MATAHRGLERRRPWPRTGSSPGHQDDWLVAETTRYLKRVLKRLDVTSRSLIALARARQLLRRAVPRARAGLRPPVHARRGLRGGRGRHAAQRRRRAGPGRPRRHRRAVRHLPDGQRPDPARQPLLRRRRGPRGDRGASAATSSSPPTWTSSAWSPTPPTTSTGPTRFRILLEERASLSPDALTGMEANHRFVGPETMETRDFGRLTAWQNWISSGPTRAAPMARCGSTAPAARPTSTRSASDSRG